MSIDEMVGRFLAWRLPEDFAPDCGISFDADAAKKLHPMNARYEPIGTNLLTATQAKAMLEHVIGGCEWTSMYPDEVSAAEAGYVQSGCGHEWMSDEDGDPPGRWMKFCPFCGAAASFVPTEGSKTRDAPR